MRSFKYTLDKSSKKFRCPECGKKSFVRFKDEEAQYIEEKFGRCDREVNCGYFVKPEEEAVPFEPKPYEPPKPPSFIDPQHAINTYKDYDQSNLFKWMISIAGEARVYSMIQQYRVGVDDSGPYTKDWVIFWQYDMQNRIRSGKIIKYDNTGHRCKDSSATWYHSKIRFNQPVFPDFNLRQCLFGEHLIPSTNKPIAIVESEKTALIASLFIDKYLWLGCGGIQELRAEKVAVLKNRSVTVFPDLGAYDNWKIKADDLGFNTSDHLEKIATDQDREQGKDLADFLV